ncbi:MAG: hypothetical protein COX91_00980 [Candidatus Nealsonbacteria bacterium CG_4_10_14_0_2_um_filter_39_15]|uniref:5'-3' exonuclease domain-containing protein n=4 Tax=Bacteria candidate phyla TaxID=1783234 RepID=A0A2H0MPT9_9BACT|nr:MAG: hypothetical protein COV64_00130 [Candidatus Nealsonbacteria bacterium CG11_big_fil_rev_8_21_14_0_20_39_9]PIZ88283.1 MAG: hypothetical protein COX91_00980 [Candidatus Nealsonbacteria bacterium CG_4_10_14_0_2_um_filter_39_15]PJC68655.1 MAG: hypothetical protein CO015_03240 [candidate division WWE3 bacterium CG_4_8_14_3_um_filter_42_11]
MEKKKLLIIDCNSLIHRAYHALPPLTTKKGELVNAVYGFLLVFFRAIKEFRPTYIAACFDFPGLTFRHKKFKEYKAKRPPTPKELYQQIPKVKEILKGFNVPIFEKEGFEADDIIGTIARSSQEKPISSKTETVIVSGDLDTLQLIGSSTRVYALKRGVKDIFLYDEKEVQKKYGLSPQQILDFKALKGDPSDNIPGVLGVGEKTATELIKKFGSLENLYKKIQIPNPRIQIPNKLKEKLLRGREQAFLSKELARIEKGLSLDFGLENCRWKDYNKEKATAILKSLEFFSLIEKLPSMDKEKENLKLW